MNQNIGASMGCCSAKAKTGFFIHLIAYVIVNAMLVGINFATTPDRLWFQWPLAGWGVGVVAHALAVFMLPRFRGGATPQ